MRTGPSYFGRLCVMASLLGFPNRPIGDSWGSAFRRPITVRTKFDWTTELKRWLEPFLSRLAHKARRRMCPLYIAGLIGPGERKSIQPMAQWLVPGEYRSAA